MADKSQLDSVPSKNTNGNGTEHVFWTAWNKSKWMVVFLVLKLMGTIGFLVATSIVLPTVDTITDFSLATKYFK